MSASTDEPSFEGCLKRLEEIVQQLEEGELELERSLELFEEGVELSRRCGTRLERAEHRITELLERAGTVEERELGDDPSPSPKPSRRRRRQVARPPEDVEDDIPF